MILRIALLLAMQGVACGQALEYKAQVGQPFAMSLPTPAGASGCSISSERTNPKLNPQAIALKTNNLLSGTPTAVGRLVLTYQCSVAGKRSGKLVVLEVSDPTAPKPAPEPKPVRRPAVTAKGSSCTVTEITEGKITGAKCAP